MFDGILVYLTVDARPLSELFAAFWREKTCASCRGKYNLTDVQVRVKIPPAIIVKYGSEHHGPSPLLVNCWNKPMLLQARIHYHNAHYWATGIYRLGQRLVGWVRNDADVQSVCFLSTEECAAWLEATNQHVTTVLYCDAENGHMEPPGGFIVGPIYQQMPGGVFGDKGQPTEERTPPVQLHSMRLRPKRAAAPRNRRNTNRRRTTAVQISNDGPCGEAWVDDNDIRSLGGRYPNI